MRCDTSNIETDQNEQSASELCKGFIQVGFRQMGTDHVAEFGIGKSAFGASDKSSHAYFL
jgi:hypothetical protein